MTIYKNKQDILKLFDNELRWFKDLKKLYKDKPFVVPTLDCTYSILYESECTPHCIDFGLTVTYYLCVQDGFCSMKNIEDITDDDRCQRDYHGKPLEKCRHLYKFYTLKEWKNRNN